MTNDEPTERRPDAAQPAVYCLSDVHDTPCPLPCAACDADCAGEERGPLRAAATA